MVIDEIQRIPELFPLLRVLLDHRPLMQKYLVLGSASRDLIRQSSESLAGRIGYLELTPFTFGEAEDSERLWLRGGFPLSFLAENDADSMVWRRHYVANLLERDIPALGIDINPVQMRRLWTMLSHLHGKVLNYSDLARSLDVSQPTIRRYVDILAGAFMVRRLHPWFANIGKRQVKSPSSTSGTADCCTIFLESKTPKHLCGILPLALPGRIRLGGNDTSFESFSRRLLLLGETFTGGNRFTRHPRADRAGI